jgi:hypothetical protein
VQLDEFVSESPKAIIKGVNDAQEFAKENDATINPNKPGNWTTSSKYITTGQDEAAVVSVIDFDVAVMASDKQDSGISGGISVLSFNVGGKSSVADLSQTVSRIKFQIEAVLPNAWVNKNKR